MRAIATEEWNGQTVEDWLWQSGLAHYGSVWTALRQLEQRRAEDRQLARFQPNPRHKLAKANNEI